VNIDYGVLEFVFS